LAGRRFLGNLPLWLGTKNSLPGHLLYNWLEKNVVEGRKSQIKKERSLTPFLGEAKREDVDKLLINKISDALNPEQKKNFIMNLLQEMRREGTLKPVDGKRGKGAMWVLHKPSS